MSKKRSSRGAEEVALDRKKQFDAIRPQMLEVGEALENLTVYGTTRQWLQGAESSWGRSRSRRQ